MIRSNSSALTALGLDKDNVTADGISGEKIDGKKGYTLGVLNANTKDFKEKSVNTKTDMASYLSGKKFTITYGGQSRSVELITKDDLAEIKKYIDDNPGDPKAGEKAFLTAAQNNLDKAFGRGKVEISKDANGNIQFKDGANNGTDTTLTISSTNSSVMRQMGIDKMNSTKVSVENSLWDNRKRLGLDKLVDESKYDLSKEEGLKAAKDEFNKALANFTINGVTIKGLNADTTVNQMISKINASDAGVKATYLNTSNKFSLISTETGSGRTISLGEEVYDSAKKEMIADPDRSGDVAFLLFGGANMERKDGQDAIMHVDFGTGETQKIVSSSNTFDLDGLKVTVSGTFGGTKEADGSFKLDNTQAVTFDAAADTEKVTEKVKKFIEDYNALVKVINDHITTKPDKSYGPLSDAQKDEMDETSIENWEKKAKEGLLYNDAIMRDLSMDISSVMNQMLGGGVSYEDLEEMGITVSDDVYDGGTLVFDEEKFKSALNDDPEKVGRVFTGGDGVSKGLTTIVGDTLKQYATRYRYLNNGSYGRLVEEAGSEKMSLSLQNNTIYKQLKDMQESLTTLQTRLKSEQDRYIKQFTYMEQAISNMNTQSSYLSSIGG